MFQIQYVDGKVVEKLTISNVMDFLNEIRIQKAEEMNSIKKVVSINSSKTEDVIVFKKTCFQDI